MSDQPHKPIQDPRLLEEIERYRAALREMGRDVTYAEAVTIAACFRCGAVNTMDEGVAHVGTVDLTYEQFCRLFEVLARLVMAEDPALVVAALTGAL